ncbi:MAG: orotate phosphoribosyltransferase [Bacteroidales bacterium]|nr:orotate phosphoribosyltransferase [Bacteroidales bacterium]
MIFSQETARQVALHLLEVKAIQLSPEKPFTWASGLRSPIYCDNRVSLSYPKVRNYIRQQLYRAATTFFQETDIVVGVATAGIPQGALVAEELDLPFAYVRAGKKDHGMTNQIEGHVKSGQKALVVEDLVSTGKSSLLAVEALREAGVEVLGMVSVFTYGLEIAQTNFEEARCRLVSLSDYDHLIEAAVKQEYVSKDALASLKQWRKDPQLWSEQNSDQ